MKQLSLLGSMKSMSHRTQLSQERYSFPRRLYSCHHHTTLITLPSKHRSSRYKISQVSSQEIIHFHLLTSWRASNYYVYSVTSFKLSRLWFYCRIRYHRYWRLRVRLQQRLSFQQYQILVVSAIRLDQTMLSKAILMSQSINKN